MCAWPCRQLLRHLCTCLGGRHPVDWSKVCVGGVSRSVLRPQSDTAREDAAAFMAALDCSSWWSALEAFWFLNGGLAVYCDTGIHLLCGAEQFCALERLLRFLEAGSPPFLRQSLFSAGLVLLYVLFKWISLVANLCPSYSCTLRCEVHIDLQVWGLSCWDTLSILGERNRGLCRSLFLRGCCWSGGSQLCCLCLSVWTGLAFGDAKMLWHHTLYKFFVSAKCPDYVAHLNLCGTARILVVFAVILLM